MKNKGFLTYGEARDQADYRFKHQEGVYKYEMEGKGWTLVEYGKVLVEGADYVHWFKKGVYRYEIIGKGCTLIEDGEVLIEGVDFVWWLEKGVYRYAMEGGDWVKINNNK